MSAYPTAEGEASQAVAAKVKTALGTNPCAVVSFTGKSTDDMGAVTLPAVFVMAVPFAPLAANRDRHGTVDLELRVRTDANDDPQRVDLEKYWTLASRAMVPATIGPEIDSPWLLHGIDDTDDAGGGGVAAQEGAWHQEKHKTYRLYMERVN
jgi:hypothetical protein